jgi:formyl-CoA transferase
MPAKLSETPATVRRPAPLLGQHSEQILAEAGFDHSDVLRWIEQGIVEQAPVPGDPPPGTAVPADPGPAGEAPTTTDR